MLSEPAGGQAAGWLPWESIPCTCNSPIEGRSPKASSHPCYTALPSLRCSSHCRTSELRGGDRERSWAGLGWAGWLQIGRRVRQDVGGESVTGLVVLRHSKKLLLLFDASSCRQRDGQRREGASASQGGGRSSGSRMNDPSHLAKHKPIRMCREFPG